MLHHAPKKDDYVSTITVNGTDLAVADTGTHDETIVFSHGLLMDRRMFEAQITALGDRYRCVSYDHRGQGQSAIPPESSIPMDLLANDAIALIEQLDVAPCHFVGLSMGGFVGLRIAARRPDLLRSLVLLDTSAGPEDPKNVPKYRLMNAVARFFGTKPVTSQVQPILFGETFLNDPAKAAERNRWKEILQGRPRDIHKAVRGVIERAGVEDEARKITIPTLVIVGEEDVATPTAKSRQLVSLIPNARLVTIPRAGHSSTIEEPQAVTETIREFLAELPA